MNPTQQLFIANKFVYIAISSLSSKACCSLPRTFSEVNDNFNSRRLRSVSGCLFIVGQIRSVQCAGVFVRLPRKCRCNIQSSGEEGFACATKIVIITKCWGEVPDFEPLLSFTVRFICGIHNENGKSKVQSTAQFTFRSKAVRDANL